MTRTCSSRRSRRRSGSKSEPGRDLVESRRRAPAREARAAARSTTPSTCCPRSRDEIAASPRHRRARRCSSRAVSGCSSRASTCIRCRRSRTRTASSSSSPGRGHSAPTSSASRGGRRALCAPRQPAAGARARRRAHGRLLPGAAPRAPLAAARPAQGGPRRRSAPADAAGDDRVVVRPARAGGAARSSARSPCSPAAARTRRPRPSATPTRTRFSRCSTRACFGVARSGRPRYWMLETIRELAAERLAADGEDAAASAHDTPSTTSPSRSRPTSRRTSRARCGTTSSSRSATTCGRRSPGRSTTASGSSGSSSSSRSRTTGRRTPAGGRGVGARRCWRALRRCRRASAFRALRVQGGHGEHPRRSPSSPSSTWEEALAHRPRELGDELGVAILLHRLAT